MSGPLPDSVLLVDDEQAVLDVLSTGFRRVGLTVKAVMSAEEAFALLETEQFGAVITDKNLPGRSGLELLTHLNAHHPNTARLVITGFVSTESVLEALRLGADDYLLKPFESITLVIQRVKKAMQHRRVHYEREQLVTELRRAEHSLRKSESTAFQKVTELDLLQNVIELRIEEATAPWKARVEALQAQLDAERERRNEFKRMLIDVVASPKDTMPQRLMAEVDRLV